jgi:sec-independent protein translocase protein TatA
LLLFGAKKIPEIAKGLGKSVSEFKKGMRDIEDEIKKEDLKKEGNNSEEKKKLAG